jgi:hypothetical protein
VHNQNIRSFFQKLREALTLSVDVGAVLRELFTSDAPNCQEILRRNSKPRELTVRHQVRYVRGWIVLIKQ